MPYCKICYILRDMAPRERLGELRDGRLRAGLTQLEASSRLSLSQPYLSQLECGRRRLTARVQRAMKRLYGLPATSLPLPLPLPPEPPRRNAGSDRLPSQLAALGYPGYAHVHPSPQLNPAVVVLEALSEDDLDDRVTEALPWMLARYSELNWDWLLTHVKLRNLQNRLGFLVAVARELTEGRADRSDAAKRLGEIEKALERARLAAETTLSRESMPPAEREWLRKHRPLLAKRWNVLTSLTARQLPYVATSWPS